MRRVCQVIKTKITFECLQVIEVEVVEVVEVEACLLSVQVCNFWY